MPQNEEIDYAYQEGTYEQEHKEPNIFEYEQPHDDPVFSTK